MQVLKVVLAYRNITGLVEEDIRRLEDGIHEQAEGNLLEPGGLVLVLGEVLQPGHGAQAAKDPAELGVFSNIRGSYGLPSANGSSPDCGLLEEDTIGRVEATGKQ